MKSGLAAAALSVVLAAMPAAAAFMIFVIVMMPAAAALAVMVMMVAAAARFIVVMMPAAAALMILVIVMMPAAAAPAVMVMMVAAAARFIVVMMPAAATLMILVIVMMPAAAALAVMVMMVAAAASRFVRLGLFRANRGKGTLFEFDVQSCHFKHVRQIADRRREEAVFGDRHAGAAMHERNGRLLKQVRITRHVEHGLDSRTDHPESPRFIDENVVHFQGAHFLDGDFHRAVFGLERLRHRGALIRIEHELLGVLQNGLRRRCVRGQELGELDHGNES